ncbi:hypothetical protein ABT272_39290 [Streptomyces sp900105245]|uniref:Uncharacterized protein n=1 Tax=Streptomyces sp. 900105245 TaxID=3154379 RepID=A0ABV1UKL6_9ACTN
MDTETNKQARAAVTVHPARPVRQGVARTVAVGGSCPVALVDPGASPRRLAAAGPAELRGDST